MKNSAHQQCGVALITALLITSLATMVAVELISRQYFDIRRTSNILETDQAYLFALGVEAAITKVVQAHGQNSTYDDPKALELLNASSPFPVEGGVVAFHVDDMEGLFNINNIIDENGVKVPDQFEIFQRILMKLGIPPEVADATLDWVDKDIQVYGFGAEDNEYQAMQPPYRPPNRRMASVSELMLVKGFKDKEPEVMKKRMEIFRWVTALPESNTKININSATVDVLGVIFDKYAPAVAPQVQSIIDDRKKNPITDTKGNGALAQLSIFNGLAPDQKTKLTDAISNSKIFDVETNYFMVAANAAVGQSHTQLNSLIMCTASTCPKTVVIARSQGTPGMF